MSVNADGDREQLARTLAPPSKRLLRALLSGSTRYRLRSVLLEGRYSAKLLFALDPALRTHNRLKTGTELVIEGFPRSANSFALVAFTQANPGVAVASHTHSSRRVEQAVARSLPTIVLIRDPRFALASGWRYDESVAVSAALTQYLRFYRRVRECAQNVVIADFDTVITDLGAVVQACNAKFGTSFVAWTPTIEEIQDINGLLDTWAVAAQAVIGSPGQRLTRPVQGVPPGGWAHARMSPRVRRKLSVATDLYAELTAGRKYSEPGLQHELP